MDSAIATHGKAKIISILDVLPFDDIRLLSAQLLPTLSTLFDLDTERSNNTSLTPSLNTSLTPSPNTSLTPSLNTSFTPSPSSPNPSQVKTFTETAAISFLRQIGKLYRNGMALFLDDIQWAASNSLQLLQKIVGSYRNSCVLVLAFRNENIAHRPSEEFMTPLMLSQRYTSIVLTRLSKNSIQKLFMKILGVLPCTTLSNTLLQLCSIISSKTKGNPFHATQFVAKIYQEKLLFFDFENRCWDCDIDTIQELQHTDDVLKMMIFEIQKLSPDTKELLQDASCIGNSFDVETLSVISELPHRVIISQLSPALTWGFVQPIHSLLLLETEPDILGYEESTNCTSESKENLKFRFVHDRIHESFYSLVPSAKLPAIHYRIGYQLKKKENPLTWPNSYLLQVCRHMNGGADLVSSHTDILSLVQLNIKACNLSQNSGSHLQALEYAKKGKGLLLRLVVPPATIWIQYNEEAVKLQHAIIENQYMLGKLEEATAEYNLLFSHAKTTEERVKALRLNQALLCTIGDYQAAFEQGLLLFAELNISIFGLSLSFTDKWDLFMASIPTHELSYFRSLPLNLDPTFKAMHETLSEMLPICHFCDMHNYSESVPFTAAITCIEKKSRSLVTGASLAGIGLQYQMQKGPSRFSTELSILAMDLSVESKDNWVITNCMVIYTMMAIFIHSLEQVKENFRAAKLHKLNFIDVNQYIHLASLKICLFMEYGAPLSFVKTQAVQLLSTFHDTSPVLLPIHSVMWTVNLLIEEEEQEGQEGGEVVPFPDWNESPQFKFWHGLTIYFLALGLYIQKDYKAAYQRICEVELLLPQRMHVIFSTEYQFLAPLIKQEIEDASTLLPEVERCVEIMEQYTALNPRNFEHKYKILLAEKARLQGNHSLELLRYYEDAIQLAQRNGFYYVAAIACERAFSLCTEYSPSPSCPSVMATSFLQMACTFYTQWGATKLVGQMHRRYPEYFSIPLSAPSCSRQKEYKEDIDGSFISIEIEHASKLLSVVEHAGANRGFIFQVEKEQIYVIAKWGYSNYSEMVIYSLPQEGISTNSAKRACTKAEEIREDIPFSLIREVSRGTEIDSAFDYFGGYKRRAEAKSAVCIPMKQEKKVIGILYLENTLTVGAFPNQQKVFLKQLAAQIGVSIQRMSDHVAMKKTLGDIQKENQTLLMLDKLRDEFVSNTSHELKTPLNGILGAAQTLQETRLTTEQQEYCSIILESAEDLLGIINNILDIQKYQSNELDFHISHFELRSVVDSALTTTPSLGKAIVINSHWDALLPPRLWLDGDQDRLEQVLFNLLSNAVKFSTEGDVLLSISSSKRSETGEILLHFEVIDSGIGVTDDYKESLFKPFSQADSSSNRKYQGAGLGLANSQGIVQTLSNGSYSIQCNNRLPHPGTSFSFTLPFRQILSGVPHIQIDLDCEQYAPILQEYTITLLCNNENTMYNITEDLKRFVTKPPVVVSTLDQASEAIAISTRGAAPSHHFCIIDTSHSNEIEFESKYGLSKFLARELASFESNRIDFLFIVPLCHKVEYTGAIRHHLNIHEDAAFVPLVTSPIIKHSVANALGILASSRHYKTRKQHNNGVNKEVLIPMSKNKEIESHKEENTKKSNQIEKGETKTDQTEKEEPKTKPFRVIMFEDNKMNQKVQERFLKLARIECVTVNNGMKGIDFLLETERSRLNEFDLILMDCHMPIMDGFEATRKIRNIENQFGLPRKHIIAITTANQDCKECYESGMCTVITKPVNKNLLSDTLSSYFTRPCCETCHSINTK